MEVLIAITIGLTLVGYSLILQRRAVRRQEIALKSQAEAMEHVRQSLEIQRDALELQRQQLTVAQQQLEELRKYSEREKWVAGGPGCRWLARAAFGLGAAGRR